VDSQSPLAGKDLDQAGLAAWWLGERDAAIEYRQRAFAAHTTGNDPSSAARTAIDLCMDNANHNRMSVAMSWAQRAQRLVDECEPCAARGRVVALFGMIALDVTHDLDAALERFEETLRIGREFNDVDVVAEGTYGVGSVLIRRGEISEGLRMIDEVMVDAVAGLLSPVSTARVYCGTISTCQALGDVRRAYEWTEEAAACSTRPGMGDFPGDCQSHRAEMTRLRGDWSTAEEQLRVAMESLGRWSPGHVGQAWYVIGEIAPDAWRPRRRGSCVRGGRGASQASPTRIGSLAADAGR
jgi:hypothetical protein